MIGFAIGQRKLLAVAGLLLLAAGCATTDNRQWVVDGNAACIESTFSWPVERSILSEIVGKHLTPRVTDGSDSGLLSLVLVDCGNTRFGETDTGPVSYARIEIPLDGAHVPWVVSGVPEDGWSFVGMIAGSPAPKPMTLLREVGFAVVPASVDLKLQKASEGVTLTGVVEFEQGSIAVSVTARDGSQARSSASVKTGRSPDRHLLWRQSSNVRDAVRARVSVSGSTPLSDLGLAPQPAAFGLTTDVRWHIAAWSAAPGTD